MQLTQQQFTASQMMRLAQLHIDNWNALVSPSMRQVGETETHILFVHATKGHRRISKKRLGV